MKRLAIGALALATAGVLIFVGWPQTPPATGAPPGDAARGRDFWSGQLCRDCHGAAGEAGFGPDLAGRGLSVDAFTRALRRPWGIMPAHTEQQVSEQAVADLVAYFDGLQPPAEPGPWKVALPAGAPLGQRLHIETAGCAQCHGATADHMRQRLGELGITSFAAFQEAVYRAAEKWPTGGMGSYSRGRLPEEQLETIWQWLTTDLGIIVPARAAVRATADGDRVTYTLTIENPVTVAMGDVYIALAVPQQARVAGATEDGYQGVQAFDEAAIAVWLAPRIAPGQTATYQVTVAGEGARRGSHAFVRWLSPTRGGDQIITPRATP